MLTGLFQIDTLSKVNHKNFVNLVGFCEEAEPFTRMLVFEYAPNGTLFEHLHSKYSCSFSYFLSAVTDAVIVILFTVTNADPEYLLF